MSNGRLSILALSLALSLSGCAAYRTSSNIEDAVAGVQAVQPEKDVPIFTSGEVFNRKYQELQRIEISIKKLTAFHADPTREMANAELKKKAAQIGADAVINVQYQSGIGLMTWGYIDAQGTGVRVVE